MNTQKIYQNKHFSFVSFVPPTAELKNMYHLFSIRIMTFLIYIFSTACVWAIQRWKYIENKKVMRKLKWEEFWNGGIELSFLLKLLWLWVSDTRIQRIHFSQCSATTQLCDGIKKIIDYAKDFRNHLLQLFWRWAKA